MDYYSQLGEVGIVLLAAKQNILVIQILEVALKLQTMQVNRASGNDGCRPFAVPTPVDAIYKLDSSFL